MLPSLSARRFLLSRCRGVVGANNNINNNTHLSFRSFHASVTCWEKLNVEGLAKKVNLDGKNVLVRVDLNVPLAKVRDVPCRVCVCFFRFCLGYYDTMMLLGV